MRHIEGKFRVGAVAILAFALTVSRAHAQPAQRAILSAKFQRDLERIASDAPGVVGFAIVDLVSGERFGVNDTLTFPQASAIKVPILLTLHQQVERGRVKMDDRIALRASDQAAGSGVLQTFGDGTSQLSLGDYAALMIVLSDNTATNVLIDRIGMDTVNAFIRSLGLDKTRLRRKMTRPADMARGDENTSSPREASQLLMRLAKCDLPMQRARCDASRKLMEIEHPVSEDRMPGVPDDLVVAWKAGDLTGVRTGWGIASLPGRPYVFVSMTNYNGNDSTARAPMRKAATAAYEYFSRLAGATPYGARIDLKYFPSDTVPKRP